PPGDERAVRNSPAAANTSRGGGMSEDVLLRQLGQVARERAAGEPSLDERWDRLAAGTLGAEEEAELRRLAETSDEAGMAYDAFRPLGKAFEAQVVAAIV